jgi:hypothetical protein
MAGLDFCLNQNVFIGLSRRADRFAEPAKNFSTACLLLRVPIVTLPKVIVAGKVSKLRSLGPLWDALRLPRSADGRVSTCPSSHSANCSFDRTRSLAREIPLVVSMVVVIAGSVPDAAEPYACDIESPLWPAQASLAWDDCLVDDG